MTLEDGALDDLRRIFDSQRGPGAAGVGVVAAPAAAKAAHKLQVACWSDGGAGRTGIVLLHDSAAGKPTSEVP